MNRLLPLLFVGVALFVSLNKAYAQPTVYVDPDFVLIDSMESTCVAFKTVDFTDIQEMRFTVRWNASALDLVDIPLASLNPAMTNLDITDFTIDQDEGYVIFTWKVDNSPGCPPTAVTLPDDVTLFELCFEGVQGYSEIEITDDPEDIYVTRLNSCPLDIGLFIQNGFIAVDNQPLTINVPYVNANEGETVCMDLTVDNFTDIVSLQFSINWLPAVVEFVSIQGVNLPGWTSGNFNVNPAAGWASCSWFNPDPTQGYTAPNGTAIVQICFEVVGFCGQTSPVSVTSNPTQIEITYEDDPGIDIGVLNGDGAVSVNCFNPNGMSLILPEVNICPGESFCMDVTTENFDDLVGFEYSLNWNPEVIQFTGISNINTNLFTFAANDFNTTGSNNGFLTVNWDDPSCFGETLPDGAVLFTVCFQSIGGGDVNTTVSFTSSPLAINVQETCNGPNNPPNTFNGFVDVCELPGVVVVAGNASANPGEQVCVDVDVQQFDNVENLQFSVIFETSVLEYTGVQNFGLPGLSAANFDDSFINFGALCLTWTPPGGAESLPDGSTIFSLCFNAIGDPFECSAISFTEFPCLIDVVTTESNGTNVGIEPVNGEVCMLNPFNFTVSPVDLDGLQNTIICVPFEVENFISLAEMDFSINWDPDILLFTQINAISLTSFNASSYDASNAPFGQLTVTWDEPVGNGLSLPNGAAIFEMCFIVTGTPGECSPLSITGTPQAIFVSPASSGGINIGLNTVDANICSSQFLQLDTAIVTGVDCVGDNSGAIDITISGGSASYTFNWSGPGIVPPNNTNEDLVNLTNGSYTVTVTDNIYGNLSLIETVVVGFSANAPVANAGTNTSLPCGEISMQLNGTGSSQGSQYTYFWQAIAGGFIDPGSQTTLTPTIVGSGNYQLAVTDQTSGCTVFDTVTIIAATSPGVAVSASSDINCQSDTIQLSGIGSSFGPNYTYLWTTSGGGQLVPGNEDSLTTLAVAGGMYYFTVTDLNSGCATTDSVMVDVDTVVPTAFAGPDTVVTCIQNVVVLSGVGSSTGANIAYQWQDPDGTPISTNLSVPASEPGFYTLSVTNTTNFCQAVDSVFVEGDTQLPTVVTGVSSPINCLNSTITLLGTGSSTGAPGEFTYLWTGPGLVAGTAGNINAQANLPGPYALAVTDNSNGCQALSVVLVTLDTLPPFAEAGTASAITCAITQVNLNGGGSSTGTPGAFTYNWTGPNVVANGTTLTPTVGAPGLYTLTVTRTSNGCTDTDTVTVGNNTNAPIIVIDPPGIIDCNNPTITLDATGTTQGAGIQYTWAGPFCINTANPLMPVVGCTGTFTLTATNTNNGCSSSQSIFVPEDTNDPVAVAQNSSFKCSDTQITLSGAGSSTGVVFSYQWTVLSGPGAITGGGTTLAPTVNGPGSFGLEVENTQNGCIATAISFVQADTIPPVVDAGANADLTCLQPTTTLAGSSGANATFQWIFGGNPIPGATSLTYQATQPGVYTLQATSNLNGCVGTDQVTVNDLTQPPLTSAGPDQELGCEDNSVVLDGTGSDGGPNITYLWTALAGGALDPATITNQSAVATNDGTYILTVTNSATGCSGKDTVVVIPIIGLDLAEGTYDGDPCALDAFVMGNLPEGTSGVWTVNTSASFEDPSNPNTTINNLTPGINLVTWTLSSPNCPNYSSFTMEVIVEGKPIANNDLATIVGDVASVEIDLLGNDLLLGITNFAVNVLPFGGPGSVDPVSPVNGVISYFTSPLYAGEVEFQYELCNNACPNLCDTAFVRVFIDKNIDLEQTVPNGITPNGDGKNDFFIIDIIEANPDRYPNNELVIFNRWGDVVFSASPYNSTNWWGGTGPNGEPLPSGTYYYILRLDIDDAEIIRGDITIVK